MPIFYENKKIPITVKHDKKLSDAPHLHNHLELVFLLRGESGIVCDNYSDVMYPGDIFLSFPNQVHSYPKRENGLAEHYIIIFTPSICSELKDLIHKLTPVSPLVRRKDLSPDIPYIIEKLLEEKSSDSPYREAITRGYLICLLGKLFDSMEFREEKQSDGILLKNILNYCNQHHTEPLSLEVLSRELNIGKFYISHIFSEKLKISFPDYVNGLRINDAIRILASDPDRPITEISYDCGFNSTRTFNRAFIKHTGVTPRKYREENLNKKVSPINFYIQED